MMAAVDVHYEIDKSIAACIAFKEWGDSSPYKSKRITLSPSKDYCPGRFYKRELPCILAVLESIDHTFDIIIIDGYVHLKKDYGKGLGAYLFESLPYTSCIIGVAKNPLKIADNFVQINRGKSKRPLFISSIGCPVQYAAESIISMHGGNRIPTLLKLADKLARSQIPEPT